jgi:hypothetical protein
MGLKGASEELQFVRNIHYSIIVHVKSKELHETSLIGLCKRLRICGMTCSRGNCKLCACKLTFFGLRISKEGVDDKVQAITKSGNPNNASELRNFLGLAYNCNTHIPDLTTLSEPLWG